MHHTKLRNQSQLSEFLLLGFSEDPVLQPLIFGLFLSMYLVTVSGNLLITLAILTDPHLHTPMYFFLANLSLVDVCFTSTTIPKMLVNIQAHSQVISYVGCITQMCFFLLFAELDNFLLAVMAYDRFVAICHPLHYQVVMKPQFCVHLLLLCSAISLLHALLQSLMVLHLSFCLHVEIHHFFCELNEVASLSCSNTFLKDVATYIVPMLLAIVPLAGILYSYYNIISLIHSISSAQGKYKAFSTCASHLSVVSLFYGTGLSVYLSSSIYHNSHSTSPASVMYTVLTPMLNPFIYSLRNTDMRRALKRLLFHN
ncbi:olfactory receptor 7A10-like [Ochotona princeps]|uniref:olfactory receptor 7A10-like n=1 Tax=Ochotona princeps TaxID=9978 RepID=UPI002714FE8A|nr:olfactory receptor 7A10-like [Ochotona princeps]